MTKKRTIKVETTPDFEPLESSAHNPKSQIAKDAAEEAKKTLKIVQIPAILNSMSNTKDGGKRLGFVTQELSIEEKLILEEFYGKFGYLLFKENAFSDKDIPKDDAKYDGKTPSQQLRACIFRYWEIVGSKDDFEVFYRKHIEKLSNQYKVMMSKITG